MPTGSWKWVPGPVVPPPPPPVPPLPDVAIRNSMAMLSMYKSSGSSARGGQGAREDRGLFREAYTEDASCNLVPLYLLCDAWC